MQQPFFKSIVSKHTPPLNLQNQQKTQTIQEKKSKNRETVENVIKHPENQKESPRKSRKSKNKNKAQKRLIIVFPKEINTFQKNTAIKLPATSTSSPSHSSPSSHSHHHSHRHHIVNCDLAYLSHRHPFSHRHSTIGPRSM